MTGDGEPEFPFESLQIICEALPNGFEALTFLSVPLASPTGELSHPSDALTGAFDLLTDTSEALPVLSEPRAIATGLHSTTLEALTFCQNGKL